MNNSARSQSLAAVAGSFLVAVLVGLLVTLGGTRAHAQEDLRPLVNGLAVGGYDGTEMQVNALAATGNPAAVLILEALAAGDLYARKSDGAVFITAAAPNGVALIDPLTGENLGVAPEAAVERVRVNNRLRRAVRTAIGALTLMNPDVATRAAAATAMFSAADPASIEMIDVALAQETNERIVKLMREARAAAVLKSDLGEEAKIEAISTLRARGGQDALAALTATSSASDGAVRAAADEAIEVIKGELALWKVGQDVWYGLSLGSVLLLAAIGLAITFGVMGVINMAHGEMVMLGAYTTFVVQEAIRTSAPWLFDWSLLIALPLAFLVAGLIGILVERGIIRFLYGRPLETLLATWGLSLILQQGVRTIFGPTNRQVGTPSWMSGSTEIGHLVITYNRLAIIVFALAVFAALMIVMKRTAFGLQMRAVTQNRAMASAMGIRTPWIDALTFGLGSGIAGIAGVALSQIDNVSPNLGQSYIIDSFMVVVFGGVGNLWGTLVGAVSLGVANKFLEPYAGAVVAKILVLVFIIAFIQRWPRGLFALKGRAAEA
jgi:urea transport system permease protein